MTKVCSACFIICAWWHETSMLKVLEKIPNAASEFHSFKLSQMLHNIESKYASNLSKCLRFK